ncbi:MAG: cation:proton antiporter [Vicinamibacterales bacterium]
MGIAADFVIIVLAGLAGAVVARALRLPLLVGYVAAGVVVGPHTAGPTITHIEDIEVLAEIGVALLLFALGLEVSLKDLRPVRRVALIGGPLQIGLTAVAGTWVAGAVTGMPATDAVWLGAMVSLSSTMVVLKTLTATNTLSTLASRVMLGLLVVQDLAVVPILIILPQVGSGEGLAGRAAQATLVAGVILTLIVVVGTRLLPALLRRVAQWGSRELFLVSVVASGVGLGFLAFQAGLSFAIGAFVAGLVLSESELSHQALSEVVPLRDVFGLLFFVAVGMLFDPRYVVTHAGSVALLVGAIVVGKAIICGGITRLFGFRNLAPWIVGLGLSQVGEFSFVLARVGHTGGFISKDTYDLALSCTVLSMAISPLMFPGLLPAARRLARRWSAPVAGFELPPVEAQENHVIVAGFGRTGRAIVGVLQGAGLPHVVVELHHATAMRAREEGVPVVWGDIASEEILRAAGAASARMLVMAAPEWQALRLGIARARQVNPRLLIVCRATTATHVEDLRALGVDGVVQPEFEGGIELVRRALVLCERSEDDIDGLTRQMRQSLYGV